MAFRSGSTGPVPEGFVAWTVGIVVIGAALRWIVRGLAVPPCLSRTVRDASRTGTDRQDQPAPTTRVPVVAFVVSIAAALGLAVVYWPAVSRSGRACCCACRSAGIGVGVISWAHRFLPPGPGRGGA